MEIGSEVVKQEPILEIVPKKRKTDALKDKIAKLKIENEELEKTLNDLRRKEKGSTKPTIVKMEPRLHDIQRTKEANKHWQWQHRIPGYRPKQGPEKWTQVKVEVKKEV